jgi:2-polyprenyl-6-methoxyphenol hydroxylase-like FAD-dependent oxidoreductase
MVSNAEDGRSPRRVGGTAVVAGASMAGLCAARVLADRFDEVLVLDRDELPGEVRARPHVPQGRHPHLLLNAGARLLERWFPGIAAELEAGGALTVDICRDVYWYQEGGIARRPSSEMRGPAMSRPFLEGAVRRHVEALPNVTLRGGTLVEGLLTDTAGARVSGVRLDGGGSQRCDLVVDATGRRARSVEWLAQLGYRPPVTSEVRVDMRYVTRIYRRTDRFVPDWSAAAEIGHPASKRLAMILPIEGDRWIMCFGGLNGEMAPTDDAGQLAYARTFESPVFAEFLRTAEPLGAPVTYRYAANQRRHVERMRRFPLGWVLLGDAVCSFDPIYGQGMTSAAQQAQALGARLDGAGSVDRSFARGYFRDAGRTVATPWSMAVGGDFAYPGTTGRKPAGTDLVNRYMRHVTIAAQHDDAVLIRLNEVISLLRRPESLMTPAVVVRVWRAARRGPVGPPGRDEPRPAGPAARAGPARRAAAGGTGPGT